MTITVEYVVRTDCKATEHADENVGRGAEAALELARVLPLASVGRSRHLYLELCVNWLDPSQGKSCSAGDARRGYVHGRVTRLFPDWLARSHVRMFLTVPGRRPDTQDCVERVF